MQAFIRNSIKSILWLPILFSSFFSFAQFDLNKAVINGELKKIDLSVNANNPQGITFTSTGDLLYTISQDKRTVVQYKLTSNYDIGTATYVQELGIPKDEETPTDLFVTDDGSKLFIIGSSSDFIFRYDMPKYNDLSTAVLTQKLEIDKVGDFPSGFTFSNSGKQLFVTGETGEIASYELGDEFDISTAKYLGDANKLDVSTYQKVLTGVSFDGDGSRLFISGSSSSRIYSFDVDVPYNLSAASISDSLDVSGFGIISSFNFSTIGHKLIICSSSGNQAIEYDVTKPFALAATAVSKTANSFDVTSIDGKPKALAFNNDGTKLFLVGNQNNSLYAFDLSIPYEINSISTPSESFNIEKWETAPTGLDFNSNGDKMYIIGNGSDAIQEFDLPEKFKISKATHAYTLDIQFIDNSPNGIEFSPTGDKIFFTGREKERVYSLDLAKPFSLADVNLKSVKNTDINVNPRGLSFNDNGKKMFTIGVNSNEITEFELTTPYDLNTVSAEPLNTIETNDNTPQDLTFGKNGSRFFITGNTFNTIEQLELFTLLSTSPISNQTNISDETLIVLTFSGLVDLSSVSDKTILITGSQTGSLEGAFDANYDTDKKETVVSFKPQKPFNAGEVIFVTLTSRIKCDGVPLTPYGFQFTVESEMNTPMFQEEAELWQFTNSALPNNMFPVDMDNDGLLDVLLSSSNVTASNYLIAWYKNNGTNDFTENIILENGGQSFDAKPIDMDNDGDFDVLVAYSGANSIRLYENDGSGNFELFQNMNINTPRSIAVVDMDLDGDQDFITASFSSDELSWFENDDGGFSNNKIPTSGVSKVRSLKSVDIDADGDWDIVLSCQENTNNIILFENDGDQNFSQKPITNKSDGAFSVATADVDGDGLLDVLCASTSNDLVAWYRNEGDNMFSDSIVITNTAINPRSVHAADINGDGNMDVVYGSSADSTVGLFLNDGSGNFSQEIVVSDKRPGTFSVFSGDFDNDGKLDIIASAQLQGGGGNNKFLTLYRNKLKAPESLVTITSNEAVELKWNALAAADSYYVLYTTDTISGTITSVNTKNNTLPIKGLKNGEQYYFAVVVENDEVRDSTHWKGAVPVLEAGKAIEPNGKEGYVRLPENTVPAMSNPFTFEAWFNSYDYSGDGSYRRRIAALEDEDGVIFDLAINNGKVSVRINDGDIDTRLETEQIIEINTWYHIAFVFDEKSNLVYIDGQLIPTTSGGMTVSHSGGESLIGASKADANYREFLGKIDEVRLWSVARSSKELQAYKDKPLRGDEVGLTGLYHFDEPLGDIAFDATGYSNHAVWVNEPASQISGAMAPVLNSFSAEFKLTRTVLQYSFASTDVSTIKIYRSTQNKIDTTDKALLLNEFDYAKAPKEYIDSKDLKIGQWYYYKIVGIDAVGQVGNLSNLDSVNYVNNEHSGGNERLVAKENEATRTPNVLINNIDLDGDILSVDFISLYSDSDEPSYNPKDSTFTYTSPSGFTGGDTLVYKVSDNNDPVFSVIDTVFISIVEKSTDIIFACDSYTVPSGDETYTKSGSYIVSDTIPDKSKKDNIITIFLTLSNSTSSSIDTVMSEGPYISPSGKRYYTSANFEDVIPNALGCDSTIEVNLTILNKTHAVSDTFEIDKLNSSCTYFLENINANDTIPGPASNAQWNIIEQPNNGKARMDIETGNVTLEMASLVATFDSLQYEITYSDQENGIKGSDFAYVYFDFNLPSVPELEDDIADSTMFVKGELIVDVLDNDIYDSSHDPQIRIIQKPNNASVRIRGTGTSSRVGISPNPFFYELDSLAYSVYYPCSNISDTAWVFYQVSNNPPVALSGYLEFESRNISIDLSPYISDRDNNLRELILLTTPEQDVAGIKLDEGLQIVRLNYPTIGVTEDIFIDSIQYRVCDSENACDSNWVVYSFEVDQPVVYNAISPNGDGYNEKLVIGNVELFTYNKVQVFDRNSTLVFSTEKYDNENNFWDGKTDNGEILNPGTYLCSIRYGRSKSDSKVVIELILLKNSNDFNRN